MADIYPRPLTLTRHNDTYPFIAPSHFAGRPKGNLALNTGAGRGIATSLALAAAGTSIACLSRTAPKLETLEAEIKQTSNVPAIFLVRDVLSDHVQIISDVEKRLGPIDILVNNAGISRLGSLYLEKNIDIWWHVQEVNVKAPMALIHACLPSMMKRGSGKIITLGSAAADNRFPFGSAYGASKAALQKAYQCLDIGGKGIVFYCIHPGRTSTTMGQGDGVNMEAMALQEVQRAGINFAKTALTDTLALAADSIVFLAADERMEVFSGRYLDCCQDMEERLQNKDKILSEQLNMLSIKRCDGLEGVGKDLTEAKPLERVKDTEISALQEAKK